MKAKLKLIDRLMLPTILPKEGDRIFIKILKSIDELVEVTEEEIKEYEYRVEGNASLWNKSKDVAKEFEFSELQATEVKRALQKLEGEKKLTRELENLVDIFLV